MDRLFVFVILTISVLTAQAAIYKYTDEEGNTKFSQTRPSASTEFEKIENKRYYPDEKSSEEGKTLIQQADKISKENAERDAARQKAEQDAKALREKQSQCATARQSLIELSYGGNRLYKDENGEFQRVTDEARKEKSDQINAFIQSNCQ